MFNETPSKVELFLCWLHNEIEKNSKLKEDIKIDYYSFPLDNSVYTKSEDKYGEINARRYK